MSLPATSFPRRRSAWRMWPAFVLVFWSVLGQGERCSVDRRFESPSSTLLTYWEALRVDDTELVRECFADPSQAEPVPGTLWFLPPSEGISVRDVRLTPADAGKMMASYEVRFLPAGGIEERSFEIVTEVVRIRGEWFIDRAAVGPGMPQWRPIPRRVDI